MRRLLPVTLSLAGLVLAGTAGGLDSRPAAADPGRASEVETAAPHHPLRIRVLSNRADLVSGGDALVTIGLPRKVRAARVRVSLDGRDVTRQFKVRADGRFTARLTGLDVGTNRLVARAKAGGERYVGRQRITNHPNGGPIFSGPQWVPYSCQPTAIDAQCNQPATYTFHYRSTDPTKTGLQPYDPANPPGDVATTTTDQGVTVPFVVRREDGFQDRDRYSILTLFRPGRAWQPWRAQKQWNHKVLATHGGGCGAAYAPGTPRTDDFSGTIPVLPGVENSYVGALGKGFAVVSTALNNTGHNCSVATEAESMLMVKERLVERYGQIRYLIGTGCSGGSIAQHTIANAYPGIYQGLVTTCSYPDTLTAGAQFADYHLMRLYFEDPSRWAPGVVWTPMQMAAVEGHVSHVNAVVADEGLFKDAINPETPCDGVADPVAGDPSTRFDSETNPGGVRCSILDIMVSLLGRRPASDWSSWEQAAGLGFAGVPFSNTGVQYGLHQLEQGLITPEMFVDLNEKLGGLDLNADPVPGRIAGDDVAIDNVYRTGLVNEANHLDEVAMINHGGPDPGIAHDYAHAFWTHERLLRDQGHTGNRVMWFGATPLIGDPRWATEAFTEMDRWLAAVEKDRASGSLAAKIVRDRPADLTDRCANVPGLELLPAPGGGTACQTSAAQTAQTRLSTPRQEAGDDVANDRVACRLRPLARADYAFLPLPFNDAQWARLQSVFDRGVCDWSRPGRGQGPAETWLTYGTAPGNVVYGGRNLPAPPPRSGAGQMAAAFRELWRK